MPDRIFEDEEPLIERWELDLMRDEDAEADYRAGYDEDAHQAAYDAFMDEPYT